MAKRQLEIPGAEAPSIPEIEDAAEAYVAVRDKRMKLTDQEINLKAALLETIEAHAKELEKDKDGNPCYRYDEQVVVLIPGKDNVKVRVDRGDEEGEE